MGQQRDSLTSPVPDGYVPPWLSGYNTNAQKFLYAIGLALDMLLEKQLEGQAAHIPGQGDPSTIPLLAADRVLVQGPGESNAQFIYRLERAFEAWARAGSRPSVLGQLHAYFTNAFPGVAAYLPEATIVGGYAGIPSAWDSLNVGDPPGTPPAHAVRGPSDPGAWNWDGTDHIRRAFLILYMHLVPTGQGSTTIGSSIYNVGGSGVPGVTSGFVHVSGLFGIVAGNVGEYITISGAFNPTNNGTFQIVARVSSSEVIIANPAAVVDPFVITWSISRYPYIGPGPVWGSPEFIWGQAHTWGLNVSPLVIGAIRAILKRWKSAGTYYPKIIVSFGGNDGNIGSEFSPNSNQGAGNPDSTWGTFGKLVNGVWIPSRQTLNPATAFCDGSADAIECYEKNFN